MEGGGLAMKKTLEIVGSKNWILWGIYVLISFAMIYIVLITSFEIVAYGSMDYYQGEYEKYGVAENLNMEMEDIMYVTEEMMDFLRGDRENLIVYTLVGGEEQAFFNETEIAHMVDVQELFIGGLHTRTFCFWGAVVLFGLSILLKANWKFRFPRAFQYTTGVFALGVGILGFLFATDFNRYFEIFHTLFFEGDTWLFDTNTSLMINMLPEGLFYDMTLKIVIVFLVIMGGLFLGACIARRRGTRS